MGYIFGIVITAFMAALGWVLGQFIFDSSTVAGALAVALALVGVVLTLTGVLGGFLMGWGSGKANDVDLGGKPTEQEHTRR